MNENRIVFCIHWMYSPLRDSQVLYSNGWSLYHKWNGAYISSQNMLSYLISEYFNSIMFKITVTFIQNVATVS